MFFFLNLESHFPSSPGTEKKRLEATTRSILRCWHANPEDLDEDDGDDGGDDNDDAHGDGYNECRC